jgi:signal transduction histidine kinase
VILLKLSDFLKDRALNTLVYFSGIFMVILTMYLTVVAKSMNFPLGNLLYAISISIVIYLIFLVYEYYKNRRFDKQLNQILESDEAVNYLLNIEDAKTYEHRTYVTLLSKIYSFNNKKISEYEETHRQYIYFINQWVHQMKTPVSVINLLLQGAKDERFNETFNSIGEENEKIAQGLDIMLNNARLNEFNLDFKVESIDIISVVRKAVNDNKKSLIRNSIFPKIINNENIKVETDKKWIYFVINQILINGIKYAKESDKEKKYIEFEIKDDGVKIVLSITDGGIGIPKEDLSRVFKPFFTGTNGRKTSESTGMGMYLSRKICDELGHGLIVESEEGNWTRFSIFFYKEKSIFKL